MKINIEKCLLRRIEMNVNEVNDVYNNLNKTFVIKVLLKKQSKMILKLLQ